MKTSIEHVLRRVSEDFSRSNKILSNWHANGPPVMSSLEPLHMSVNASLHPMTHRPELYFRECQEKCVFIVIVCSMRVSISCQMFI